MSAFVWVDRDGRQHELDGPAPIEAEAADIAQEMDRYVATLGNPDRKIRDPARAAIRKLQPRLERLCDDLASWNDHAVAHARAEAEKLAGKIDELPAMIADVRLVVDLHKEHERVIAITSGSPEMLAKMLAQPMTDLQGQAIAACASRTVPPDTATRGEAKIWLDAQPRFARNGQVDGGWFGWMDRYGHAHRLIDPFAIEREIVTIARELAGQRDALTGPTTPEALYAGINQALASWGRLEILQGDLERFDREAEAREDTAWDDYAADWRSRRTRA